MLVGGGAGSLKPFLQVGGGTIKNPRRRAGNSVLLKLPT